MKPDQERVRSLLTDTVTLLCKNGLYFSKELKVEGVLGITLDDNDVFIVHINEKITEQCCLDMRYGNDCAVIPNAIANSTSSVLQQGGCVQSLTESMPSPKGTTSINTRSPSSLKRRRKEFPSRSKAYISDYTSNESAMAFVKLEDLRRSADADNPPLDESTVDKADRMKEENLVAVSDSGTEMPAVEILSDFEVSKTDDTVEPASLSGAVGLDLSVKEEKAKNNNNDVKVHANYRKSYKEKTVEINSSESLDIPSNQNDSESFQAWFQGMVPSGIDELESFPLNNNNNHPKGRCTDGYSSTSSVPQKVTNVPLVTDLIGSSRMKKAYLSVGQSRPTYNLPLQDPSASLVPCPADLVIERHQRVSLSSYDQMIVESEVSWMCRFFVSLYFFVVRVLQAICSFLKMYILFIKKW